MSKPVLKIVKIGGNIINDEKALKEFLYDFSLIKELKILVHGGGKRASELLTAMGIAPKMINGRRVTDENTLEVVTMVYAGLLNKNIVSKLQGLNCNAIGLSGADGNSIRAHKRVVSEIDYGFAGDVNAVNNELITQLIKSYLTPVFCAITHDKNGQLLNTNADTIATELAIAMSNSFEVELNYVFELQGVLNDINDKDSIIEHIDLKQYNALVKEGIIADGMLPKLQNCFNALKKGVRLVKIGNAGLIKSNARLFTRLNLEK